MSKKVNKSTYSQILDAIDKLDTSSLRYVIMVADTEEKEGSSYIHASMEDMENLILYTMRSSSEFVLALACAVVRYNDELFKKGKLKPKNKYHNEEN